MQRYWPTTPSIVGCCMLRPFAHPVAYCRVLLGVVVQSSKLVKRLSQQPPTFLLFRDRWSVAQQHPFLEPCTRIPHGLQSLMGCILPTMHCRSQHCLEPLHPFAHHCQHGCNNCQHSKANNVGSCCVRLRVALKDECYIYSPSLPWKLSTFVVTQL